jgi:1-deoxy-D-xylulose-5-phosphate reductoisomerase
VKRIAVLGSTGSIGRSTLSIVESFPDQFAISTLAAGTNLDLLRRQIATHRPVLVSVAREVDARTLRAEFPDTTVTWGAEGLVEVATHDQADTVVAALVGSLGLPSTLAAIESGRHVALANKETLVVAGDLVMAAAARHGVHVLPVDSEHNAIHQALRVGPGDSVHRLVLTASGGPFRTWEADRIAAATVDQALAHPTWSMGPKITIDSATLMNKGLEIIEAHHLFAVPAEHIDVVVHPQSLVHSLVEYVDGTYIAQLSVNDMRFPILYALAWPDRLPSPIGRLDLTAMGQLSFEPPDPERFPALRLAREALVAGGEMPAVLNAANEEAVATFLDRRCTFPDICRTVEAVMARWAGRSRPVERLDQVMAADTESRALARELLTH